MYERRGAGGDPSLACPFLALAGDRDARTDVPDRRHRCYAESDPAPRAIAHQEAYCLTSGFVGCPTFQDWVRREGARLVPSGTRSMSWRDPGLGAGRASGADVAAAPIPVEEPVDARHERVFDGDAVRDPGVHGTRDAVAGTGAAAGRSDAAAGRIAATTGRVDVTAPGLWGDDRSWAAPPPWLRDESANRPEDARVADELREIDEEMARRRRRAPAPNRPELALGQAALRGEPVEPIVDRPAGPLPSSTRRPFGETRPERDEAVAASASAADLVAEPSAAPEPGIPGFLAARHRASLDDGPAARLRPPARDGEPARPEAGSSASTHTPGGTTRPSPEFRPDGSRRPGRRLSQEAIRGRDSVDGDEPRTHDPKAARAGTRVPPWEQGRRHEAYPDLRPRLSVPQVPRLGIAFAALLIAAIVLFLLPTVLPNLFGGQPTATRTPAASVAPSVSVVPSAPPAPTPEVYTVAEGDTLSGIATKFGFTVDQVLKANPQIKNPNKLAIGDQVTIPSRAGEAVQSAGASALP